MLRRFVVLMAAALPLAAADNVRVVEEIAAKVNGDIVTGASSKKRSGTLRKRRARTELPARNSRKLSRRRSATRCAENRRTAPGAEGQGYAQHQCGWGRGPVCGADTNPEPAYRRGQAGGVGAGEYGHHARGAEAAQEGRTPGAADRHPGSGLPCHHPGRRAAEVLRRAQDRVRARGAGISQPDSGFHRREDAPAGGRSGEEGQGSGEPGARRREIRRAGPGQFRRHGHGQERRISAGRLQENGPPPGNRRRGFRPEEGLRLRTPQDRETGGLPHPED